MRGRVYTLRLGYGSTGQRTTHRLVAGGYDQTTAWGYTEYGQLKTLTPPGQPTATTLEYNADGLNTGRYAPGLAFTTGFSGVHAPSGLSYGVPALNREYGYEPATGFLNTRIQADSAKAYAYDALGQLSFIKHYTVKSLANDCGQVVEATGEISEPGRGCGGIPGNERGTQPGRGCSGTAVRRCGGRSRAPFRNNGDRAGMGPGLPDVRPQRAYLRRPPRFDASRANDLTNCGDS